MRATLRGRLHRAGIQNHRRRLTRASRRQPPAARAGAGHGPSLQSSPPAASVASAGRPLPSAGNHAAASATGRRSEPASAARCRPRAGRGGVARPVRFADSATERRRTIPRRSHPKGRVCVQYSCCILSHLQLNHLKFITVSRECQRRLVVPATGWQACVVLAYSIPVGSASTTCM